MTDATGSTPGGGPPLTLIALLLLVALLAAVGKPVPRVGIVEVPPSAAVLANPQHALGLLAAQLGADVTMHAQLPGDDLPPASGGVLWLAMPGHLLDASRLQQIRAWVEAGGTLVIAPVEVALHEDDPLAALGDIEFFVDDVLEEEEEEAAEEADESEATADVNDDAETVEDSTGTAPVEGGTDAFADSAGNDATEESAATCDAGGDGAFGTAFPLGDGYFAWAAPRADIQVSSANADASGELCGESFCHAVRVPLGRGHVLALADASMFDNQRLDRLDHALIAQRLFHLQPGTTLWIIYDETVPSLAALVWHYAKPALFSALVALALWLLAVSARFGPLQPSPLPLRRRLAEHIEAAGLLLARHGAHRQLWQAVHDDFWRRFMRRHPQAREADAATRLALIARQSGLSADDVRSHLSPPASSKELPAALRNIAFLRSST